MRIDNIKKEILIFIALICGYTLFVSCEKATNEESTVLQKLYGDYILSDIHWPGLAVDLNNDGTGYWELLYEFQNKIGYYEPDYVAKVGEGIVFSEDKPWAKHTTAFNVTLPCPFFVNRDGIWICTSIRSINVTLRATDSDVLSKTNCCFIYPEYDDSNDVFLAGIQDVSLVIDATDATSFQVGLHCSLPSEVTGKQTINENYLYYTYSK